MHVVFRHLDSNALLNVVPRVCRAWRAFVRTFAAPELELHLAALEHARRPEAVARAAAAMPLTQALSVRGMIAPACQHLSAFANLRRLDVTMDYSADKRLAAWRRVAGPGSALTKLACLRLSDAGGLDLNLVARAGMNLNLRRLEIKVISQWSLFAPVRLAVLRVLKTTPNLTSLLLERATLDRFEVAAALLSCPRLISLALLGWRPTDTTPDVLASIREHAGKDLKDLTFTVTPAGREMRQAYCSEAFAFFKLRPGFQRLCLRNADCALQKLMAVEHLYRKVPASLFLSENATRLVRDTR